MEPPDSLETLQPSAVWLLAASLLGLGGCLSLSLVIQCEYESICSLLCLSLPAFLFLLPQLFISVFILSCSHSSSLSLTLSLSLHLSVSVRLSVSLLFPSFFPSPELFQSAFLSRASLLAVTLRPHGWWGWAAGQGGKDLSSMQKMGQLKPQGCSGS